MIEIVFQEKENRSVAYDGVNEIGECEYSLTDGAWTITHTEVDPSYGGQGIAAKLLDVVVNQAREKGVKIIPHCSFAQKMFQRKAEYQNVLNQPNE